MRTSSLPFHESIVLLIQSAQSETGLRQYANLAKLTTLPKNQKEVARAISKRGKELVVGGKFAENIVKIILSKNPKHTRRPAHEAILIQLKNISPALGTDIADGQIRATGYVITRTHLPENVQKIREAFRKAAERIGFQKADPSFYNTVMNCLHEHEPA